MSTQTRVRPSRSKAAIAERTALQAMSLVVAPAVVVVPAEVLEAAVESVIVGETYTHVGFAVDKNGKGAVRYTNDKRRAKTLIRAGCTSVQFIELPKAMSKADIDASDFIAMLVPVVAETAVA